jgi:hypothetical protein
VVEKQEAKRKKNKSKKKMKKGGKRKRRWGKFENVEDKIAYSFLYRLHVSLLHKETGREEINLSR